MHVEVNGTRLWFDVDGPALVPSGSEMRERPTVVLLHGGPGSFDHSYFKPDFSRLASVAQVVYLDLPGHGRSDWGDPTGWSFELCADALRDFCDALGIAKPIVYGHSLGSFVAMVYGIRHAGHAGALVLQSAFARFDRDRLVTEFRRRGGDEVAEIARRSFGGGPPPVTDEEWDRCWRLFGRWVPGEQERARTIANSELNPAGVAEIQQFDVVAQLGRVECPTLVCVGELDPMTPVSAAREIAAALPEGLAQLEVIEAAGHFTWKDAPERYWPVLLDFVSGLGGEAMADRPRRSDHPFRIRPAGDADRVPLAVLFAAIAEERDGIATEPPVDIDARAAGWTLDGTFVATAGDELLGSLHVQRSKHGFGEIGMAVAREWRGRGVGTALLEEAIAWARREGLHKLSLGVFAHNSAAIALYRKLGFVEEGWRVKHYRRTSGELWDALEMGLLL